MLHGTQALSSACALQPAVQSARSLRNSMDGTFSIFLSAAGSTAGLRGVRRATNFFEGAKRVRVVTAIQVGREMVIARFADKKKTVHPFP